MTQSNITELHDAKKRSDAPTSAPASASGDERNPGVAFNADWVEAIRVNLSAAERRVASLAGRRTLQAGARSRRIGRRRGF